MTGTVHVFNGAAPTLTITVNNGGAFTVRGTSSSLRWTPLPSRQPPSFTGAKPAKGALGYGTNNCGIGVSPGTSMKPVDIDIPGHVDPGAALQLYFFGKDIDHVTWVLLADGFPVAGKVSVGP